MRPTLPEPQSRYYHSESGHQVIVYDNFQDSSANSNQHYECMTNNQIRDESIFWFFMGGMTTLFVTLLVLWVC
jgi:hypothetical protein